jgi:Domain of unknown function (DUF4915)
VADGWREHRRNGGVAVDVATGEVVCAGLSMPHSPRWHEGRLYLLNSGSGELGRVDLATGRFEPLAFLPGYGRGLAFVGPHHAVVGLSEPRENRTFAGLPLQERLERERVAPRCGLFVVDLRSGDAVHWLRMEGVVRELYDVAVIPGRTNPSGAGDDAAHGAGTPVSARLSIERGQAQAGDGHRADEHAAVLQPHRGERPQGSRSRPRPFALAPPAEHPRDRVGASGGAAGEGS